MELQEKRKSSEINDVDGIIVDFKEKASMLEDIIMKNLKEQERQIKERIEARSR